MTDSNLFIQQFEQRKRDHIRLALSPENEAIGANGLDMINLQHEALPDIDFSTIDISSVQLGQTVKTPFFVSSMTAGHDQAININQHLIAACAQTGWAMGVGSQRRELHDEKAKQEWQQLRQQYPDVCLFGNLGLSQLIKTPIEDIQALVDSLQAQAMIIHSNPLQECLQPEGTPQFAGGLQALTRLCYGLSVPVILKETGCGFSQKTLNQLKNCGLAAVDVSGFGGTHWGRIEGQRADQQSQHAKAAQTFANWGISTVDSLLNGLRVHADYELWASGGVRNGLDAAKLLALGAKQIGFAKPMLQAAIDGTQPVIQLMQQMEFELKTALFCTGSSTIADLKETVYVSQ